MDVETIFDHEITQAEVVSVLGTSFPKEEYLKIADNQDEEYVAIRRLFLLRRDHAKADLYLNKIKTPALVAAITEVNEGTI